LPFLFATVVPKCSNLATFSKDLLAVSKLWFSPTFWWQERTI
jgi:hypothetical protein